MWRSMLCVGTLSLSRATDTCDGDEEQSLLQGRAQLQPLLIQPRLDPATLLHSVQNMAHRVTEAPEEVTNAISSVRTVVGMMNSPLDEEHSRSQLAIQHQIEEVQACHSSEDHGVEATGSLADELAIMDACMTDETSAAEAQLSKCNTWANHASRLVFPATIRSASAGPEEVYEIAQSLRNWAEDSWPTVESKRTECDEATIFASDESARCAPVIAAYDDTFCQHRISCTLLTACHRHEIEVYHSLVSDSSVGMTSRQNQFRTIKQVECIVDLIADALSTNNTITDSNLAGCDQDVDVSHLTLSFPDPAAMSDCPLPQDGEPQCPEVNLPQAWQGGDPLEESASATTCEGVTSCAEVYASGSTQSGTYTLCLGGQARDMYCEMANDGQWMLVTVITQRSRNLYDKYPIRGDNYEGLASNTNDWASLSETDLHDAWFSLQSPVLKLHGYNGGSHAGQDRWFYFQRLTEADFSPWRALRYGPEWGTSDVDYRICGGDRPRNWCYNMETSTITRADAAVPTADVFQSTINFEGEEIEVSTHGIPNSVGCAFVFQFNCPDNINPGWCQASCSTVLRENVVTKVYIGGS